MFIRSSPMFKFLETLIQNPKILWLETYQLCSIAVSWYLQTKPPGRWQDENASHILGMEHCTSDCSFFLICISFVLLLRVGAEKRKYGSYFSCDFNSKFRKFRLGAVENEQANSDQLNLLNHLHQTEDSDKMWRDYTDWILDVYLISNHLISLWKVCQTPKLRWHKLDALLVVDCK